MGSFKIGEVGRANFPVCFGGGIKLDGFKIYSISDRYIEYLQKYCPNVYSNKVMTRNHNRKYVGIILICGGLCYYIPLSSPKNTDFQRAGNKAVIKKSIVPIMRIVAKNREGNKELLGTLRISHMIPVPEKELSLYDIKNESDLKHRKLVENEMIFIRKNRDRIQKNAETIYRQKIMGDMVPGYVDVALDYKLLEVMCKIFERLVWYQTKRSNMIC